MEKGKTALSKAYARAGRPPVSPRELLQRMSIFQDDVLIRRYRGLEHKPFLSQRLVDWEELRSIGDGGVLESEVRRLYFFDRWSRVFGCEEVGFKELTLEFLTSFSWRQLPNGTRASTVSFRILGTVHSVSLQELAYYAGFYSRDDLGGLDFANLGVSLPEEAPVTSVWRAFTNSDDEYEARRVKATKIVSPALRFMQHLLSHSLVARTLSQNVVGWQDMISLYSMWYQYPLHLGYMLAFFLEHEGTSSHTGAIGGAYYITGIARRMGLWNSLPPMQQVTAPSYITRATMVSFRLLRVVGRGRNRGYEVVMPGDPRGGRQQDEGDDEPEPAQRRQQGAGGQGREVALRQPARQSFSYEREERQQSAPASTASTSHGWGVPNLEQRIENIEANQAWMTELFYQQAVQRGMDIRPPPGQYAPSSSRHGSAPVIVELSDSEEE